MSLNDTPRANRLHITILGRTNAGKSTLINALVGSDVAITSPVAGTTADPVSKSYELHPIGPVVICDTAGFDDEGELGALRVAKTEETLLKTDIAIMVFAGEDIEKELLWLNKLKDKKIPTVCVVNKSDLGLKTDETLAQKGIDAISVSAEKKLGIDALREAIVRKVPENFDAVSLTGHLVSKNDVVMLVMPQDIQAPKGRLILPQVQTIRDLLDGHCIVVCATALDFEVALAALASPPKVIICDSQCFCEVYDKKPQASKLTSFSVLMANYKGDIDEFVRGAAAIDALRENDRVLIAEACSHNAQDGDIARVKIPNLLRKKVGGDLQIDVVSGVNFDNDLSKYKLIIHCGACMFNRKYVLSRIEAAKEAGVPITNYGVALAHLGGILPFIELK